MATLERLYQYNISSERELDAGELDNSSRLDAGVLEETGGRRGAERLARDGGPVPGRGGAGQQGDAAAVGPGICWSHGAGALQQASRSRLLASEPDSEERVCAQNGATKTQRLSNDQSWFRG